MTSITVYHFKCFDITKGEMVRSKRPATLEAIAHAKGTPMEESALEVDASRLDGNGFLLADKTPT